MKRVCLLLLPAALLVLAASGCNEESKPSFTRVRITPDCGVAPVSIEANAYVTGGDESGDFLGGNNTLDINWSFGDGGSGRTSRDFHTYQTLADGVDMAEYTVTVTAKDPQGNTATATVPMVIFADSLLVEATTNFPDGVVTTADVVEFDFIAMNCDIDYPAVLGDSVKVQILWEMNDPGGHVYNLTQPEFRFDTPGDYTVDLTITDPAQAVTRRSQVELTVTP